MKKTILLLTILLTLGMFTGCKNDSDNASDKVSDSDLLVQVDSTDIQDNEPNNLEESPNTANENIQDTANEHIQNAAIESIDTVHISPKYVRYEDNKLLMDAYVFNGFANDVYNINNIEIELSNNEGTIAHAFFANMDGAVIAPKQSIVWTFIFEGDTLMNPNANLQELITNFRCNYNY